MGERAEARAQEEVVGLEKMKLVDERIRRVAMPSKGCEAESLLGC